MPNTTLHGIAAYQLPPHRPGEEHHGNKDFSEKSNVLAGSFSVYHLHIPARRRRMSHTRPGPPTRSYKRERESDRQLVWTGTSQQANVQRAEVRHAQKQPCP